MKVLTLNLGLFGAALTANLRIPFGRQLSHRLAAAPEKLADSGADVIALQEVYATSDRFYLTEQLRTCFPYSAGSPRAGSLLGNGLMVLSRFPLLAQTFVPCRGDDWTHFWWHQGFLLATIDTSEFGPVRLMNVHLSPMAALKTHESPTSTQSRNREITAMLAATESDPSTDILIGDFNCSPDISPSNYVQIGAAGFDDAFVQCHGSHSETQGVTWDAANPLNTTGRYRASPSQRIDHVFLKAGSGRRFQAVAAGTLFREPFILSPRGPLCLSDHYGMLVEIESTAR